MKPKRRVITRSPHRTVGLVACAWLQLKPIEYESQLERRFIQRALLVPGVIQIISQPFAINYGVDGKKSYTPDFLVIFSSGKKFVAEVKPEKFVDEFADTFDTVYQILKEKNMLFCVVTDRVIDVDDIPDDVEILLRYARGSVSQSAVDSIVAAFANQSQPLSISDLQRQSKAEYQTILHMLGRRLLHFTGAISISTNTLVCLSPEENHNDYVCVPDWLNASAWIPNVRIRSDVREKSDSIRGSNHTPNLYVGYGHSNK